MSYYHSGLGAIRLTAEQKLAKAAPTTTTLTKELAPQTTTAIMTAEPITTKTIVSDPVTTKVVATEPVATKPKSTTWYGNILTAIDSVTPASTSGKEGRTTTSTVTASTKEEPVTVNKQGEPVWLPPTQCWSRDGTLYVLRSGNWVRAASPDKEWCAGPNAVFRTAEVRKCEDKKVRVTQSIQTGYKIFEVCVNGVWLKSLPATPERIEACYSEIKSKGLHPGEVINCIAAKRAAERAGSDVPKAKEWAKDRAEDVAAEQAQMPQVMPVPASSGFMGIPTSYLIIGAAGIAAFLIMRKR